MQAAHAIAPDKLVESKSGSKLDYDKNTVLITLKLGQRSSLMKVCEERDLKNRVPYGYDRA